MHVAIIVRQENFVPRCWIFLVLAFEIPSAFSCRSTIPRRMTTGVARPENDACSGEACGWLAVEIICLIKRSFVDVAFKSM